MTHCRESVTASAREALLIVFSGALLSACSAPDDQAWFTDVAQNAGVDFTHFNGMSGELYFAEMMGAGVALLDYDLDGDLDIYFVQGRMLGADLFDAQIAPRHPLPLTDRLYRNDSDENGLRFADVTVAAGLPEAHYGMGATVGDVNGDTYPDIYVTAFGPNRLLLNDTRGGFRDVTQNAGTGDESWSVSASFVDFDRDGLLDLYTGNYVDFRMENHKPCRSTTSARDYCSPLVYRPIADRLLRNLGAGKDGIVRFADVSEPAGILRATGGALGVFVADFTADGWPDIFVANDGVANLLWVNDGTGGFVNRGGPAGVAVNMGGAPEASMGVDAADFDGDGDEDLFMTHLQGETNTLYVNDGAGYFDDRTVAAGLGSASLPATGFGTAFVDYDNDGWLDLVSANGAVTGIQAQIDAADPYPLRQANQLFRNDGGHYVDVSAQAGPAFSVARVSRGLAVGDLDNDGDPDLVISNNNGPAAVLRNDVATGGWLGLTLRERADAGPALAAQVALEHGGRTLSRRVRRDGSYASARDPRVVFGLGATPPDRTTITVRWADGTRERFAQIETGRYHTLTRGDGQGLQ